MHRSRIGVVLVDHPDPSHDAALRFWAGVQGAEPSVSEGHEEFASLGRAGSLELAVQRLGTGEPRVHLDIETDDVAAEVQRVVGLGAEVVEQRRGYTILRDPGGLPFCVVPVQTGEEFERSATTWA